jgi:hypothetical protein
LLGTNQLDDAWHEGLGVVWKIEKIGTWLSQMDQPGAEKILGDSTLLGEVDLDDDKPAAAFFFRTGFEEFDVLALHREGTEDAPIATGIEVLFSRNGDQLPVDGFTHSLGGVRPHGTSSKEGQLTFSDHHPEGVGPREAAGIAGGPVLSDP